MTLLIGKIVCNFVSLGVLGGEWGFFLMNLHDEILRLPAFPLPFQLSPPPLPPQMKHMQVFVSSMVSQFSICVVTSWDVSLAPGPALSCVALIVSQSRRKCVSCPRHLRELWASWVRCQHSGDLTAEDRFCVQSRWSWLDLKAVQMQVKEFSEWVAVSLGMVPELEPELTLQWRNFLLAWIFSLSTGSKQISLGDFWL